MQKLSSLFLTLILASYSQEPSPSFASKLDSTVPDLLKQFNEPGIAVAIMESCGPAAIRTYGVADREKATPVREDTMFGLQSISKTFAAWAVLHLVHEGRINLDDPVGFYLKRWEIPNSSFDRTQVTVRRLLSHTAGLSLPSVSSVGPSAPLPTLLAELEGKAGPGSEAVLLAKAPGLAYEYSGGGYAILQLLVQEVTGKAFSDYVESAVLRKIGMKSTTFSVAPKLSGRVSISYDAKGNAQPPQRFSALAASGLFATAGDMGVFLQAHCKGPGAGVITPETLASMMEAAPLTVPSQSRGPRFGMGYMLYPARDTLLVGHSGSGAGWSSQFLVFPNTGLGIAVLSNSEGAQTRNAILRMFRDSVTSGSAR